MRTYYIVHMCVWQCPFPFFFDKPLFLYVGGPPGAPESADRVHERRERKPIVEIRACARLYQGVFFFFVYLWVSFALGHRQDFWLQRVSQRVLGLLPRLHPETLTSCTQKHILRIIDLLHNLLHRALFTHNRGSRSLLTLVQTSGSLTQPPP